MKTDSKNKPSKTVFQKKLDSLKKRERVASLVGILSLIVVASIILFTVYNNNLRNQEIEVKERQIDTLRLMLQHRDSSLNDFQNRTIELLDSISEVVRQRDQQEKVLHYNKKAIQILQNPDAIISQSETWSGRSGNLFFKNVNVVLNGKGNVNLRAEISSKSQTRSSGRLLIEFFNDSNSEVYSKVENFNMKPVSVFSAKSRLTEYENRSFSIPIDKYLDITSIKVKSL
ncbi:hypothetical protein GTQ34_14585 [Muricauda sp. JGD-17]|uniref:Uncharacterized protein n=1 Tax=Flagellimonas ochracea TaxID=2696472 RepID=A0A964TE27_9FLAO|nr:hypothetical protein [Allomuricauda ochracea]NAY93140.1 hypothetical protein [Allomuricauda ochracea]